jgi:hypothetical protein
MMLSGLIVNQQRYMYQTPVIKILISNVVHIMR